MSGDDARRRPESAEPPDAPKEREPDPRPGDGVKDDSGAAAWDAHDARRRLDQFAPPQEPCECWCMHCRRVFMSDEIWFQRVVNDPQGFEGFWKCPTPNCGGAGFTFDIHPTDPAHPANADWWFDDADDGEGNDGEGGIFEGPGEADAEWDPDEPDYKALDEMGAVEGDGDLEGEEWKYGLQPGERPPAADWAEQERLEEEAEERKYDMPDERPRVIDWGASEDRREPPGGFAEDDIPF